MNAPRLCSCAVQVTWEDLAAAEQAVGTFGGDNRAGVQGTLHRISAIRNRKGTVIGLTCRVGRAVTGHIDMIRDMLEGLHTQSWVVKSHAALPFSTKQRHTLQVNRDTLWPTQIMFESTCCFCFSCNVACTVVWPCCWRPHVSSSLLMFLCLEMQFPILSCFWAVLVLARQQSSGRWRVSCQMSSTNGWSLWTPPMRLVAMGMCRILLLVAPEGCKSLTHLSSTKSW